MLTSLPESNTAKTSAFFRNNRTINLSPNLDVTVAVINSVFAPN